MKSSIIFYILYFGSINNNNLNFNK